MNNSEIQLRDHLIFLLERLDTKLLQRVLDYTSGLVAGAQQVSDSDNDWWDDLSPEQQELIDKGLSDLEKGEVVSDDDFRVQVSKLLDHKKK